MKFSELCQHVSPASRCPVGIVSSNQSTRRQAQARDIHGAHTIELACMRHIAPRYVAPIGISTRCCCLWCREVAKPVGLTTGNAETMRPLTWLRRDGGGTAPNFNRRNQVPPRTRKAARVKESVSALHARVALSTWRTLPTIANGQCITLAKRTRDTHNTTNNLFTGK